MLYIVCYILCVNSLSNALKSFRVWFITPSDLIFRALRSLQTHILRHPDYVKFGCEMSCGLVYRGPGSQPSHHSHDDVIKWKHSPRNWPFVRRIHRSPVNAPHKGQRRGALMFSLICAWINNWVNNRKAGDLRRNHAHYDVIVMVSADVMALKTLKPKQKSRTFADDTFKCILLTENVWT